MASYHPLSLRWLNIMGDYIDQESMHPITFLTTFRQQLRQERHKPNPDEAFEHLCQTETSYAPDRPYLPVPDEYPHQQMAKSRLCHQKLSLDNSIVLYAKKSKWDILPFEDELDADTRDIVCFTGYKEHSPDDSNSSDGQHPVTEDPEPS